MNADAADGLPSSTTAPRGDEHQRDRTRKQHGTQHQILLNKQLSM